MPPTVQAISCIFEDPEIPKPAKGHKRVPSVGDVLRGRRKENSPTKHNQNARDHHATPSPLGERHINSPPQPKKVPLKGEDTHRPPMHKKTGSSTSLKEFLMGRDKTREEPQVGVYGSPKKNKSSTNLASLLKKRSKKDLKENILSVEKAQNTSGFTPTPIWAQFATQSQQGPDGRVYHPQGRDRATVESPVLSTPGGYFAQDATAHDELLDRNRPDIDFRLPQRPFLEHKTSRSSIFTENLEEGNDSPTTASEWPDSLEKSPSRPISTQQISEELIKQEQISTPPEKSELKAKRSSRILNTIATLHMKARRDDCARTNKDTDKESLSPQDIDSAMENMLGRYDIPQNLRDQLRNLKPEVKAGLVKGERVGSGSSFESDIRHSTRSREHEKPNNNNGDGDDKRRSRSQSRPRSRILSLSKRNDSSPSKEEKSSRSRSKTRPKSIDMGRPPSARGMASTTSLASVTTPDCAASPGDFIHYLSEVQKPELVEVGKMHKLRILLRNESVTWTDAFVKKGGMDEIVQLLYRIMKIEWREEHEDNLLHETLLCLKALSTTSLAMQRLEVLSKELFPALLKMLFDPERKGPAEYGTRGIIIALIFSRIANTVHGNPKVHEDRARELLSYMRDPAPEPEKQSLDFVTQMHTSRPYRIWCKEVSNITKEVFWIFLHNANVVPKVDVINDGEATFAATYFPTARAPHPAAPYVGGVEWEATQYLATHLDLLNALIVSLPTQNQRNALREEMRQSGWERVMGGSLRTCKEKFYGGVHDGLRAWVSAAKSDGWPVEDVRAGPPRDIPSPRKSPTKKKMEEAPKLNLEMSTPALSKADDGWL